MFVKLLILRADSFRQGPLWTDIILMALSYPATNNLAEILWKPSQETLSCRLFGASLCEVVETVRRLMYNCIDSDLCQKCSCMRMWQSYVISWFSQGLSIRFDIRIHAQTVMPILMCMRQLNENIATANITQISKVQNRHF